MPDEATSHAAHHHRTSSLHNGLNTSNATLNHFLGGQQRSWTLPSQLLAGADTAQMPQSPDDHSRRARQAQKVIYDLLNGNRSEFDRRILPDAQLQQANDAIGVALNRGQHAVAEQISRPFQSTNSRLLLDLQARMQPATSSQAQAATSFYSSVGSPTQMSDSPSTAGSVGSHPLAKPTSSSPVVASTSGNMQQGPRSHQTYPTNGSIHPSPRIYTFVHPQAPRGQLSTGSMLRSGAQSQENQALHDVQAQLRPQHSTQPLTTANDSNELAHTSQNGTKHASTLVHLPRIQSILTDPRTRDSFKEWASQRVILLKEACNIEDLFYLTLHQIYCWRSVNRKAMPRLGITGHREVALASLEVILIPNSRLEPPALEWFSGFPTDPEEFLRGTNPEASRALKQIQAFLDKLSTEWAQLSASCLTRQYPPSPYELSARLGLPSKILQTVFFTFVFRQIEGADNGSWLSRGTQFFKLSQAQLFDKMNRINLGLPEPPPSMDNSLAQFASEYVALRTQFASRPVMAATASSSTSHTVQTPIPVPAVSNLPQINLAPYTAAPTTRALPEYAYQPSITSSTTPSGVFPAPNMDVAGNVPHRSVTQIQPVPSNPAHPTPTMGPRQQNYIQEMTWVTAMSNPPLVWNGCRVSYPSSALLYPAAPNAVSPPVPGMSHVHSAQVPQDGNLVSPATISQAGAGRLPIHPSNDAFSEHNRHSVRPKSTLLLPPEDRQMQLSTHPNPNLVGLHQARLQSPEPQIIPTEASTQAPSRLFQVLQRFVLPPQLVTTRRSYYDWQIDIPPVDASHIAQDLPMSPNRPTSKVYRAFKKGSITYRLRCIVKSGGSKLEPTGSEWSTAATNFPSVCFVSLNMDDIPIRRKSHFGKNFPCDLTSGINSGLNLIEMSVHLLPEEQSNTYAVAIEQIETLEQGQCLVLLTLIEQPASLAAIVSSLALANVDEDIAIVDPHISIDLIDPFTAQICVTPVRGKTCTHRECFDLQAFLESRPRKVKGVALSSADEWRCPICNKDARPQSLLLDGFLLSVCKQLRAGAEEAEEVRAIMVGPDGAWSVKFAETNQRERDREMSDGPGPAEGNAIAHQRSERSTPSKDTIIREARGEVPVVIDLDSD